MTVARPFDYLRYNPEVVGDPGALLAPPYDVVTDDERNELVQQSPYQSALLELPDDGDPANAARLLRKWIDDDVLDLGEIGIAVVRQRYIGPDGVRRTRTAVACEVGLREFGDGEVLPHEQTYAAPREVRLDLMRSTGANISPVFLLYHDPERSLEDMLSSITDDRPDFTGTDPDGTQTAVWFVTDPVVCEQFSSAVAPHPLLIADGHHRYTAALAYRDEQRVQRPHLALVGGTDVTGAPATDSSGPDGVLAVVANSADTGICVFPTHRVLHGIDDATVQHAISAHPLLNAVPAASPEAALEALQELAHPGFAIASPAGAWVVSVEDQAALATALPAFSDARRRLDVTVLHELLLDGQDGSGGLRAEAEKLSYTRSNDEALAVATSAEATVFFLRSAPVEQVHDVARAGELLPQKSTYFFPKVPTGVVFRLLQRPF